MTGSILTALTAISLILTFMTGEISATSDKKKIWIPMLILCLVFFIVTIMGMLALDRISD